MKEILLSKFGKNRGKYVALVDDEDYEWLNQFNWHAHAMGNRVYAERQVEGEKRKVGQFMHWDIMGHKMIDHIFGNGLDNQRANLRPCNKSQNMMNSNKVIHKTSKYKGVYWHKEHNKWVAHISDNGKQKTLGDFMDEIEAAKAYDKKAVEMFGEFARPNF